jgi:hypothetical protein
MTKAIIDDVQIRLVVEIEGATFVTSWYGPRDKMRFAAFKIANRLVPPEERVRLEAQAREIFTERIAELEKIIPVE